MRHILRHRFALRAAAVCAAGVLSVMLVSCGGYGSSGSGSGMSTCGGGYANACPPPTVTVSAPSSGATVSGTVTLTATATASSTYGLTIKQVTFLVDGTMVGMVASSPYSVMWNSTSVANGSHSVTAKATDSNGDTTTSSAVNITVQNTTADAAAMTAAQMSPAPMSKASGMARLTASHESGTLTGSVRLEGLTAISVAIHEGFAGASGPALITLTSGGSAGEWTVPSGATLTAEQLTAFSQGKLYVVAASAAYPGGEIRGQILPESVVVTFSPLARTAEARGVGANAGGVVATTVDRSARTLSVEINSTGVDDADAAQIVDATSGRRLAALNKDSVDTGHWSTELTPIGEAELAGFQSGQWQATIATAVDEQGALEGQ